MNKIYGSTSRNLNAIKDTTENLFKEKRQIHNRWREHYMLILNQQGKKNEIQHNRNSTTVRNSKLSCNNNNKK